MAKDHGRNGQRGLACGSVRVKGEKSRAGISLHLTCLSTETSLFLILNYALFVLGKKIFFIAPDSDRARTL